MTRFGSVCSGIEAASVAFNPLGWEAAWFSEIEPFCRTLLKHHYPHVPNLGDMTTLPQLIRAGVIEAPDVLCGGTPCQAFSVAGARKSLDDARGNLTLTFCEIADAIDHMREVPCVIKWENVPGVLSTKDNAFGCFLGELAGEDCALQPPGGKWTNSGAVFGPTRTVAWRTLDAQYFGLAQRRKRVFVVASARKDFDPCSVLFEWDGVRRDSAPSRETREDASATVARSLAIRGRDGTPQAELGDDLANALTVPNGGRGGINVGAVLTNCAVATLDASYARLQGCSGQDANHGHSHLVAFGGNRTSGSISVAAALNAHGGAGRMDFESETFVTHSLRGEGFDASEDGTGRGTPLVACAHVGVMPTMTAGPSTEAGRGARSGACKDSYVVAVPFDTTQITSATNRCNPQAGDPCHPLAAGAHPPAIAFNWNAQAAQLPSVGRDTSVNDGLTCSQRAAVASPGSMTVRRLTPRECERLQGFSDDYTLIPYRNKPADQCPDGPRYKALGNSWAIPCVAWIGKRIDEAVNNV